ncbi:sensor histidine kinase [Cohnella sp. GCM10027633]|uniref:sensor histidine kinase n=1 Tax=unclassified Cohnella TaxID=2636738 RepID=UPI003641F625
MLFVWIALWAVALIVWLSEPRSPVNRRLGLLAFSGGAGACAATLANVVIPSLSSEAASSFGRVLYDVQAISSVTCYYGVPYAFLLFAMAYRPIRLPASFDRWSSLALLLPIAGFVLFTPFYSESKPVTFEAIVWWAIPHFAIGAWAIVTKPSRHYARSRAHWIICLAVLPPALFAMVVSYILPSLGMREMWRFNTWFVGIGVAVFFGGLFTYGFLGVRVLIDRRRLDSTMRAVTSGTAILHHAIKNDVGKMRLFGEKMKAYAESTGQPELLDDVQAVLNASRHIQEMIARVHRRTEDLVLRPAETDLGELIERVVRSHEPKLGKIALRMDVPAGWQCRLDAAQVGEAINNVVSNAIEAMAGEGTLEIALRATKRELSLEVRDSGPGMDKSQAARALEPFYTTKRGDANFGLGLPYAYHVIRKHGGSLHIRGKAGSGTIVALTFPKRSVRALQASAEGLTAPGRSIHG